MPSTSVFFDLTDTADDRFDPIMETLLIALLAFMPLALGAVYAWSETVVLAIAAALFACLCVKLFVRPDVRFVWSWTYAPIALFILLVSAQLLPLPQAIAKLLSPNTVALKSDLLSAVPESMRHLDRVTLSFYPEATRANLRMLLAVAAVYVVAVNVLRRMEQVRRVLAAVAIIGVVVAMIGLIQYLCDARQIYFSIPAYNATTIFGPFANRSHYAQFINLSIGASLGLMLIHVGQLPRRRRHESTLGGHFTRPVTWPVWVLACAIALMAVTICIAGTRGGMVSTAAAAAATALIMATQRALRRQAWAMLALASVVGLCVLAFQFERTYERLATMTDFDTLNGRLQILRDIAVAWREFPVFGTGLGTFEQAFPQFDRSSIPTLATHAENEYAQLLMETGVIGAATIVAFLVMIAFAYARCVRMAPSPMASAALGIGFGLIAILVHSATDFGQHVPSNACLTALGCALLVNLANAVKLGHGAPPAVLFRGPRWPRAAGAIVAMVILGVVLVDGISAWRGEASSDAATRMEDYLARRAWAGDDVDYSNLIVRAAEASKTRPANIRYRERLSFYRWKSITRDGVISLDQPRITRQIVDELLAGAWHCPTYGPTYSLAGQLERHVLGDADAGERHIRLGCRLAPTNPGAMLEVALLDAQANDWDGAMAMFDRIVALGPAFRIEAIDAALNDLQRPDVGLHIAGDDLNALNHFADALARSEEHRDLVEQARRRAAELIHDRAAAPDAPAKLLAAAARLESTGQNLDGAIALYRRALQAEYEHDEWRLELSRVLAAAGRIEEAIQEARIVQRGSGPGAAEAQKLIGEFSTQLSKPK